MQAEQEIESIWKNTDTTSWPGDCRRIRGSKCTYLSCHRSLPMDPLIPATSWFVVARMARLLKKSPVTLYGETPVDRRNKLKPVLMLATCIRAFCVFPLL